MELSEAISQLKESLGKYAKSRMLHIGEVAEELKVTENYLIDLARRGKIKAFKVGEHWFMEEDWVSDYRRIMKGLLHQADAIEREIQRTGWSRPIKASRVRKLFKKITWPKFVLPEFSLPKIKMRLKAPKLKFKLDIKLPKIKLPQIKFAFDFRPAWRLVSRISAASIILALFSISFSYLMLPLLDFSLHRHEAARLFVSAAYGIYGYPVKTIAGLNIIIPINDEQLTGKLYALLGRKAPGRVAGAYEFKLEEYFFWWNCRNIARCRKAAFF